MKGVEKKLLQHRGRSKLKLEKEEHKHYDGTPPKKTTLEIRRTNKHYTPIIPSWFTA
jgi:hypothetical protein